MTNLVLDNLDAEFQKESNIRKAQNVSKYGIAGVSVVGASLIAVRPVHAQTAIADVTAMVNGLGALAGAALVVALAPMAISFAFKIIRRVMA